MESQKYKAIIIGASGAIGRELILTLLSSKKYSKITIPVRRTIEEQETLKKDISYDNIKKKKNEVKKPKLIITEKKYPKTPVLKTKRRGRKIIHEAKKTNITNLLKNKNTENEKKNNLTPEKTLKKHINQTTNVSYCLNYNKNALNKTPEEKKKGYSKN